MISIQELISNMSESKGVVGLTNIGNTCYGNATLQALRHQVDLTIFLLQGSHTKLLQRHPSSEKSKLLEAYAKLCRSLWTGEGGIEKTHDFWSSMIPAAVLAGFDQFRIPVAHDAHEFLVFLLDQFHEAMKDEVTMVVKADHGKKQTREALDFWKKTFEKQYSPLVELVFGLQRKAILCGGCAKESVSWETMNMFKVSVPKITEGTTLQLLDLMCSDAKVETIEDYHCDHCAPKRHTAQISHTLWRLGNWVICVLKRIDNTGRRVNTPVEIPTKTMFSPLFHSASTEPSKNDTYELFATIQHHGSANGGHYTSQAKHPVSGRWAFYDDERATVFEEGRQPILDASTYIVMYRRILNTSS